MLYNDMLLAADYGQLTAFCLLDLTSASDTVDRDLLLLRLERQFGLQGVTLQRFCSYLSGRSLRVLYSNQSSPAVYIVCSVPQGSVPGTCLFIFNMAYLVGEVKQHQVSMHA